MKKVDEQELAQAIATLRECPIDSIPDALTLFDELPTPRSLSEHWSTTVRFNEFVNDPALVFCSYNRTVAIRLAWLAWKQGEDIGLKGDSLSYKPQGWPDKR